MGGGNLAPARLEQFYHRRPGLLAHAPGDENPDFIPKGELHHVPSAARLVLEPEAGLDLTYGPETCRVRLAVKDEATLEYRLETTTQSNLPAAGHLTLLPASAKRSRRPAARLSSAANRSSLRPSKSAVR